MPTCDRHDVEYDTGRTCPRCAAGEVGTPSWVRAVLLIFPVLIAIAWIVIADQSSMRPGSPPGFPTGRSLVGHQSGITRAMISPDSRWLVTEEWDGPARMWDMTAENPGATSHVESGPRRTGLAFSPDSRWLAMAADTNIHLWGLTAASTSHANPKVLIHQEFVSSLAISPDSRWVVAGGVGGTARIWDLTAEDPDVTSKILIMPSTGRRLGQIFGIVFSPDSHWVVIQPSDSFAWICDLNEADPGVAARPLRGYQDLIYRVVISPDSHWVVTQGAKYTDGNGGPSITAACVWDLTVKDPSVTARVLSVQGGSIDLVSISRDSRWVVTGGPGGWPPARDVTPRIWNLTSETPCEVVLRIPGGHQDRITSNVAISPDSHWVVAGSEGMPACIWDLTDDDPNATARVLKGRVGQVASVTISPDSHWVITEDSGFALPDIWDLTAVDPNATVRVLNLISSTAAVVGNSSVSISPDSHWVVKGMNDGTVCIWDLTTDDVNASARTLKGHKGPVSSVTISPDSHWVVTTSADKTARIWELRSQDSSGAGDPNSRKK